MKNTLGNNISLTLFGESHGPFVGVVLDGLAPGMLIDETVIADNLKKRRPVSGLDTPRVEKDEFRIISGAFNGYSTGTPLTIIIPNENVHSSDYQYGPARPSHADYAAFCKYHGFEDYRGGGHFSGRITAGIVAAGGILIPALEKKGIAIKTEIVRIGDCENPNGFDEEVLKARDDNDSVGGITETVISGVPAGVGEPWFDSVEGLISKAMFAIGGIKGIEFGYGFGFGGAKGSEVNDSFRIDKEDGSVITSTNNNGGINGGITNGMPIVFRCAVKPTPSIARDQQTVDFINKEECTLNIKGRHDPAIIRRISPVINSLTSLVMADILAGRFGTDYFTQN